MQRGGQIVQDAFSGDIPVLRAPSAASTSRQARSMVERGDHPPLPFVLQADRQTGGIGRFGRPWESPPGGLWMTLVWPLADPPTPVLDGLGLRLGLACRRAIERACGGRAEVRLKWPNDILIGGRKAAGILTEVVARADRPIALVGIGVNTNFPGGALPENLRGSATTLLDAIGHEVELGALRDDILCEAAAAMRTTGVDADLLAEARASLWGVGASARVRTANGDVVGMLRGLDPRGRIVLLTDQGEWVAPEGAELLGGQE